MSHFGSQPPAYRVRTVGGRICRRRIRIDRGRARAVCGSLCDGVLPVSGRKESGKRGSASKQTGVGG